ncbi:MAG: CoA transferase [Parasporobacterium sp.]|nr:CoA transferase [Parasporobacterium sp.]
MKLLENITIIDMTTYAAGPSATRILADMGATVIKIEPIKGEAFRVWGRTNKMPVDIDENPAFEMDNVNKLGIALDMKSPEGQEILYKLLEKADAFCSNYRLKALERLGLTYETIHEKFPKLVYGFCSGYGSKGPKAQAPGFDYVAYWARGGIMEATGELGGNPAQIVPAGGDQATGVILAGAICAALLCAKNTGIGEKVEVSLYQSAIWLNSLNLLKSYYGAGGRESRLKPSVPLLNSYMCKDGRWISIAILEHERYWRPFCSAIGREDLFEDERFSTLKAAQKNSEELTRIVDAVMLTRTIDEWEKIFNNNDIASQRLLTSEEINEDEQALSNDYLRPFTFRNGNTINMTTAPFKVTSQELTTIKYAPRIGENTVEIMKKAGYSDKEIKVLKEKGIIEIFES